MASQGVQSQSVQDSHQGQGTPQNHDREASAGGGDSTGSDEGPGPVAPLRRDANFLVFWLGQTISQFGAQSFTGSAAVLAVIRNARSFAASLEA